jgi:lipoate-protein ligase A
MYTGSNNIAANLALEQHLYSHEPLKTPTLLLYSNDKTIVIGKHQNPWKECFLDRIEQDGVMLARRKSGGGAVYHDLGNLCFSFLTPVFDEKTAPLDTRKKNNEVITRALKHFGIDVKVSGRNDLEANGRKFSGSAYQLDLGGKFTQKKALHHGTILIDLKMGELSKYLNPSKPKLKSKGIDSVISRVINLKEINPEITKDAIQQALRKEFLSEYLWCSSTDETVHDPLSYHDNVKTIYQQWTAKEWVLGQTPEFTNNFETRFDWGIVDVYLEVKGSEILSAKVFSDCLIPDLIDTLNDELNSKAYHYTSESVDHLADILRFKFDSQELHLKAIEDLRKWIRVSL